MVSPRIHKSASIGINCQGRDADTLPNSGMELACTRHITVSNLSICFECHRSRSSPLMSSLLSSCLCHPVSLGIHVRSAAMYPLDSLASIECVINETCGARSEMSRSKPRKA